MIFSRKLFLRHFPLSPLLSVSSSLSLDDGTCFSFSVWMFPHIPSSVRVNTSFPLFAVFSTWSCPGFGSCPGWPLLPPGSGGIIVAAPPLCPAATALPSTPHPLEVSRHTQDSPVLWGPSGLLESKLLPLTTGYNFYGQENPISWGFWWVGFWGIQLALWPCLQTALNAELKALPGAGRSQRKPSSPSGKSGAAFLKHLFSTGKGASKAAAGAPCLWRLPAPESTGRFHGHLISVPSATEHSSLSRSPGAGR